jgi:hypothetical protein
MLTSKRYRRVSAGLVTVVLLAFANSCRPGDAEREIAIHPIADSLSIGPSEAVRINYDRPDVARFSLVERILGRHSEVQIGALEGESEYVLGEVGGAAFLENGSLAVLDRQVRVIRVYDTRGQHVQTAGGGGEGPGELDAPMALLKASSTALWVVDGAQMIHRFSVDGGGLAFRDRIAVGAFPRDACVAGDESIVLHVPGQMADAEENNVLYRLNAAGETVGRFAAPYRYTHFLAAGRMRQGMVACADDNIVLLAFQAQNRLDAYRISDGALLWHATVDGLRIPAVRETELPDGRRALHVDARRQPVTHTLLGVSGGAGLPVLIQYARFAREDLINNRQVYAVDTFIVDPLSGHGTYLGDNLPQVLVLEEHRIALLHPEPYPRVEVARLAESRLD